MISGMRHAGLVVRNLERSLQFYRDILGLKIRSQMIESGFYIERLVGIPGAQLEWIKLETPDGALLELIEYKNRTSTVDFSHEKRSDDLGFSHVAFTVENLESLYETLRDRGYKSIYPPQLSPDGNVMVMYCCDPDGIIVELVEDRK